jgi:hypothetical protein
LTLQFVLLFASLAEKISDWAVVRKWDDFGAVAIRAIDPGANPTFGPYAGAL